MGFDRSKKGPNAAKVADNLNDLTKKLKTAIDRKKDLKSVKFAEMYNKCCVLRSQLEDLAMKVLDSGNSKQFDKIAEISHKSSKILSNYESLTNRLPFVPNPLNATGHENREPEREQDAKTVSEALSESENWANFDDFPTEFDTNRQPEALNATTLDTNLTSEFEKERNSNDTFTDHFNSYPNFHTTYTSNPDSPDFKHNKVSDGTVVPTQSTINSHVKQDTGPDSTVVGDLPQPSSNSVNTIQPSSNHTQHSDSVNLVESSVESSVKNMKDKRSLIELEIQKEELKLQQLRLKYELQLKSGLSSAREVRSSGFKGDLVEMSRGEVSSKSERNSMLSASNVSNLLVGNDIEPLWRVESDGGLSSYLAYYVINNCKNNSDRISGDVSDVDFDSRTLVKTNKYELKINTEQVNLESFVLNLQVSLNFSINISSIQVYYFTSSTQNPVLHDNLILYNDNLMRNSVVRKNINVNLTALNGFPRLVVKCIENDGNLSQLELLLPVGLFLCILPLRYDLAKFNQFWNSIEQNKIRVFLNKNYVNIHHILNLLDIFFNIILDEEVIHISGYANEIILGRILIKNNTIVILQMKSKSEQLISSSMDIIKELFSTLNNRLDHNIYNYTLKRVKQLPLKYQPNLKYNINYFYQK